MAKLFDKTEDPGPDIAVWLALAVLAAIPVVAYVFNRQPVPSQP